MTEILMDNFTAVVRDTNGVPVVGAVITVFNAVDSDPDSANNTLAGIFSDRDGVAQIDQDLDPLVTDINGRFSFYATGGYYHVRAEYINVTDWVKDVAVGTAQSLDIQNVGGGGGAMPNEVRMFVGEVPAGWEKIQTQPQDLQDSMFTAVADSAFLAGRFQPLEVTESSVITCNYSYASLATPKHMSIRLYSIEDASLVRSVGSFTRGYNGGCYAISPTRDYVFRVGVWRGASGASTYATTANEMSLDSGAVTELAGAPVQVRNGVKGVCRTCGFDRDGREMYLVTHGDHADAGGGLLCYDRTLNLWTELSSCPDGFVGGIITHVGGGVFIISFTYDTATGSFSDKVYIYQFDLDLWSELQPLAPPGVVLSQLSQVDASGVQVKLIDDLTVATLVGGTYCELSVMSGDWSYAPLYPVKSDNSDYGFVIRNSTKVLLGGYRPTTGGVLQTRPTLSFIRDANTYLQSAVYYARKLPEELPGE